MSHHKINADAPIKVIKYMKLF